MISLEPLNAVLLLDLDLRLECQWDGFAALIHTRVPNRQNYSIT